VYESAEGEGIGIVYQDPVHVELKRDYAAHARRVESADSRSGSLFERYQFVTPGMSSGVN